MADNITLNAGSGGDTVATEDIAGVEYQKVKLVDGTAASTTAIVGTSAGELVVSPQGSVVDSTNSSTTPLGISGVFTGSSVDVTNYASVSVFVFADQNSATDGFSMEFSSDGTNWDVKDQHSISASQAEVFILPRGAQFFRVVYTNGGTGQGAFRLETLLNSWPVSGEIEELDIALDDKDLAQTVRAVLAASNGTNYVNIDATNGGNLKISVEEGTQTPADADATPTDAIHSQSFNMVYNGATWDFLREGGTAGSVLVDGSGVTQPVSGTVTANPASGTIDTVTNLAQMGAAAISMGTGVRDAGTQRVTIATNDVVPASQSGTWNIGTVTAVTDITNTIDSTISGDALTALQLIDNPVVAHDAAISGSTGVSVIGARASNSIEGITQVANADATQIAADLNGCVVTRPHTTLEEIISERVSDTAATSTNFTNFGAGGVGIHNYVTTISIYNSSATDVYVDFRDGSAGSIIFTAAAPAAGGSVINLPVPLKGADNTALAYDVSAAATTVYISVVGFQAKG